MHPQKSRASFRHDLVRKCGKGADLWFCAGTQRAKSSLEQCFFSAAGGPDGVPLIRTEPACHTYLLFFLLCFRGGGAPSLALTS